VPFSLSLGWISMMTLLDITIFLSTDPINFTEWPEGWSVMLQSAIFVISAFLLFFRGDMIYVLAVSWTLVAIAIEQKEYEAVKVVATIYATVLGFPSFALFLMKVITFCRRSEEGESIA